jgi:hypothetical protein
MSAAAAYPVVQWLHVLVMGYWIGSDLVINQLAHYTARSAGMSGPDRGRLWHFLMDVDQHPRNALILSLPLGLTLAAWIGLSPITGGWLVLAWVLSGLWFWQMWATHLQGASALGATLRRLDWWIRYVVIAACVLAGGATLLVGEPFGARWLGAKVLLFGGVIACGLGIRHYIRKYLEIWPRAVDGSASPADEAALRRNMREATWVLVLLHVLVVAIGLIGVLKPF